MSFNCQFNWLIKQRQSLHLHAQIQVNASAPSSQHILPLLILRTRSALYVTEVLVSTHNVMGFSSAAQPQLTLRRALVLKFSGFWEKPASSQKYKQIIKYAFWNVKTPRAQQLMSLLYCALQEVTPLFDTGVDSQRWCLPTILIIHISQLKQGVFF